MSSILINNLRSNSRGRKLEQTLWSRIARRQIVSFKHLRWVNQWKVSVFIIFLVTFFIEVKAQEGNFSLYQYSPLLTNPGEVGTKDAPELILNYRNQSVDIGKNFQTSMLSGYYPINIDHHRFGIGVGFINDKASDFLVTNGGITSIAYSVTISESSELSLGMQAGYFQKKINTDFTTDNQFVNGNFNAVIPLGENLTNSTKSYFTSTTGLYWQLKSKNGEKKAFAGVALFNFNKPNISFVDHSNNRLERSLKAIAGYKIYQTGSLSIFPNMRYINGIGNSIAYMGSWFKYNLHGIGGYMAMLNLGVWYNTNQVATFSIEYMQPNMSISFGYDFAAGSEISAVQNRGVFEVALSLRIKEMLQKRGSDQSHKIE